MAKKITQYPASGGNPDVGSLIDISELSGGVYTSKKLTIQQLLDYLTANLDIGASTQLYNNTGATIQKGTPVQIGSGVTGLIPNLKIISSSDASNDGKIFISEGTILNGASGNCIENGLIQFPSLFATGDKVFWNVETQTLTNLPAIDDQIFIGIIVVGANWTNGKMFVAPRFSPSLVKGASGQIPLFLGERKVNGNTHFTFIDNNGTEVGFRFSDDANNLTQVGVTYLNVESEGIASNSVLRLANWSDSTNKGIVSFRKSRGSKSTPTQVFQNDAIGHIIFAGQHNLGAGTTTALFEVVAKENYDVVLNTTTSNYERYALTEYKIFLAPSFSQNSSLGGFPNQQVFSVDGDGTLRLKNNKLVFQYDNLQNVNLTIGDSNDKIFFDELTGQFTFLSNTQNPTINAQSGTTGFYPKLQLAKGETGGNFPYNNSILGSISTNEVDFIKLIAREDHTLSDRGTDVVFYALLTGGGSYQQEALRISALDGKVQISGSYLLPNTDGATGQTLVTNGAGVLSWANGGGISGGGVAGKLAFWNSATNVSYNNLIDVSTINEAGNGSHARLRVGSSDTASQYGGVTIYKGTIFQSTTGETISSTLTLDTINKNNAKTSQLNLTYEKLDTDDYTLIPCIDTNILGEINFQGYEPYGVVAFIKSILTENQTTANKGNKLVFSTIINGTATPFNILILDGDGRVKISDAYKLPLLDGASGTSLITDGQGNVAWGTPSASASTSMQTIGRNSTGSTLYKGTVVSISGSTGNRPNFVKAQANAESTSAGTFGIVVSDIANNSDGYVATIGTLSGLDTRAVATNPFTTDTLVDGDTIYLSPTNAGYVTNVKPSAPNHLVYIGKVVQTSPTNGTIVYRIQNGYELDEIHDVAISGVANDDVLQYESATGLWKNKPLSTTSEDIWKANPNETYRGISLNNNSTTVVSDGGVVMSSSASTLAQSVSSTNFASKQIRLRYYASVVSAGRYTGTRGSALLWYLHGGFRFVCDFNISDTAFSAGCQQFYGMGGQTTDLNYGGVSGTLVSTLLNVIGIGSETNDANLQVFHNDASGTCTKIDLGASFPANRTSGAISTTVYQIQILNVPSSSSVLYKVINKETGAIASGTLTTNLPDATTGLNFFASRCMSTIASATNSGQFDLMKLGVYSML